MNKEIKNYLLMQYNWAYHKTKDWDSDIDLIRLRNINKLTKEIYAETYAESIQENQ